MTATRTFHFGAIVFCLAFAPCAFAQQNTDRQNAPLVADGVVRQAFERAGAVSLLEIEVTRAEVRKASARTSRVPLPAPGDLIYVHLPATKDKSAKTPAEEDEIRVYLQPREAGGWESVSLERTGQKAESPAEESEADNTRTVKRLGLSTELIRKNRAALRVVSVERGGLAQAAGLEVGDLIIKIDNDEINSADQLEQQAAARKTLALVVVDVNSGRPTLIALGPKGKAAETGSEDEGLAPEPPKVKLGLSAEPVRLGTRSALKVIRIDPNGLAAKAGLELGDMIVAANGVPTTGVEQMIGALRKSGPTLTLTVRDKRTDRDVDVKVPLQKEASPQPEEAEPKTDAKEFASDWGAVTELAFHDSDFAVKVTEVKPGSAAARAGLKPGLIIVAADGKPVLHPNDLNNAVRQSSGAIKLTVVDPDSDKQSTLSVKLR